MFMTKVIILHKKWKKEFFWLLLPWLTSVQWRVDRKQIILEKLVGAIIYLLVSAMDQTEHTTRRSFEGAARNYYFYGGLI